MRFGLTVAAAAVLALTCFGAAGAQAPVPDMKTFASSADVQALIANARKIHKPGEPLVAQPILSLAPYRASLEYRAAVGPAAVHEKEAEFFYVIDGSATLVTGGKLAGEKRQNPTNLSGTGIDGGQARDVSKGDFIVVPEGTPHWFSAIKGEVMLMSLHVPRG
jgi:mannose-6-phosphate isomerase-like protein (cupin superfamily)